MHRTSLAMVLAAVAAIASALPARAAGPVILSGPGSQYSTYSQPVTAAQVGGDLTYVNGDIAFHDVLARDYGSDVKPWCGPPDPSKPEDPIKNPRGFPFGKCPVFWSNLIGLSRMTPVLGTDQLLAGRTYDFYCSLHPWMFGALVALPG